MRNKKYMCTVTVTNTYTVNVFASDEEHAAAIAEKTVSCIDKHVVPELCEKDIHVCSIIEQEKP